MKEMLPKRKQHVSVKNNLIIIMKFTTIKLIDGASNYAATILGDIINLKTNHILKPCHNGWAGYMQVGIKFDDGREVCKTVHRLVYEAFCGKIPNGMVINHKDEDKTNNALSNLEMISRADNIRYGNRTKKAMESRKNGTSLIKEYNKKRKTTRSQATIEKHREITRAYWNRKEAK